MGTRFGFTVALAVLPSSLASQAVLTGTVREDSSKTPVAGVEIVFPALDRKTTTDSVGHFVIGGLAHGMHHVVVRAIGYRPIALRAYVVTNDTLEVDLRITRAPVILAPIEVTATAIPRGLETFEERRLGGGPGQFIDWTVLRKQENRRTSDLFREVPGVRIRYNRYGQAYLASSRGGCAMQVYLDGLPIYKPGGIAGATPPLIDDWTIANLDAIEVYRGAAETPIQMSGSGANCGTVVLWTRRH